MKNAFFRFYAELNDFLPERRRAREFSYEFDHRPTVKHVIESIGVPHTEIDLILVNGISVDFGHYLADQDRVSVYPVFERFDIFPILRLRPKPLRKSVFILDVHLGKLARMLRLLGFDALYRNDYEDTEIVRIGGLGPRIVLTRDRQLLKAKAVTHGYWVRSLVPEEQLEEILYEFDLFSQIEPFQRCVLCNGRIYKTSKELVLHLLEPKTKLYYDEFFQCGDCGQVFWKGSHFPDLKEKIDRWMLSGSKCSRNG